MFLKNFYSIYDYDQQEVRLGVNIHSKDVASIRPYREGDWVEYEELTHHQKTELPHKKDLYEWRTGLDRGLEKKIGATNGDLPQEQESYKTSQRDTIESDWKPNEDQKPLERPAPKKPAFKSKK